MTFDIFDGVVYGNLKFSSDVQIPESVLSYIKFELYNFNIIVWYDFEQNIVLARMTGSIISMMQFRKFIQRNYPDTLDE